LAVYKPDSGIWVLSQLGIVDLQVIIEMLLANPKINYGAES
jgi:hypothetical protein